LAYRVTASLEGRVVLVTGASRGIGRAVAVAVAAQGAAVVAVARDARLLDDLIATLPGSEHRAVALDVRDQAGWDALGADLPHLDGLVTAAGVYGPIGRIDTVDMALFRDAFEVNLFGTLLAVRACIEPMAGGGSIVMLAGGGSEPLPGFDAYVSSKAAIVRLAENLAAELEPSGIRVNTIAPGFVATDIHRATVAAGPAASGADFYARTVQALAEGGFPPSEPAELAAFLLSDAASAVNGRFLSARWDEWRDPNWRAQQLATPASLTMRRIDGAIFTAVKTRR
jgi:NAD(P)-dependent dehydrogenase (short-subunit alcohol dehydrogenase family)